VLFLWSPWIIREYSKAVLKQHIQLRAALLRVFAMHDDAVGKGALGRGHYVGMQVLVEGSLVGYVHRALGNTLCRSAFVSKHGGERKKPRSAKLSFLKIRFF
jgi:hypothetical protein